MSRQSGGDSTVPESREGRPLLVEDERLGGLQSLMRSFFVAVSVSVLFPVSAVAQKAPWQVGGHVIAALPQGELYDVVPNTRWGGLGYFTRRIGETPYRWGVEVGAVVLDAANIAIERGPQFVAREAQLSSDMLFGHFLGRVQPVFGRFSPYLEGAIGARAFENSITYFDCVGCTLPTSRSHVTFSAGGGGGIAFRLRDDGNEAGISLETRVRYLFGGTTEYFSESGLPVGEGSFPRETRTDLWMISFGVVLDF
jgi:hypothetical protein